MKIKHKTEIKILPDGDKLIIDIYVNNNWFKQIMPEGLLSITKVLNCVADSLENDEDYNINY